MKKLILTFLFIVVACSAIRAQGKSRPESPATDAELVRLTGEWADAMLHHDKARLEDLRNQAEKAEREGDFGRAAEIRYGRIVEAEKELAERNLAFAEIQKGEHLHKEEVDAQVAAGNPPGGRIDYVALHRSGFGDWHRSSLIIDSGEGNWKSRSLE